MTRMALRLDSFDDFAKLPKSYCDLIDACAPTFDQTDIWYRTFAEHLLDADSRLLLIGVSDESGRALGLLPLRQRNQRLGPFSVPTLESLTNYYTACFAPLIAADVDAEAISRELVGAIAARRNEWSRLDITPIAPDHPFFKACDALRTRGCRVEPYFRFGNHYLEVAGRDFASYLEWMPSRMRSTLKRKSKKLLSRPDVRLEIVTAPADVDAAMDGYERVYSCSWKHEEPHKDFIRAIARRFAERGWLRLGVARVGDEVAAAQIWYCFRGTASIFKLAYDPKYTELSVGSVLTMHLMRHAHDVDKVAVVDYLCGDDAYKKDWMSHRRERWAVRANPWLSVAGVSEAAMSFAGRMRRAARGGRPAADAPLEESVA
jgi:hypothetical protein